MVGTEFLVDIIAEIRKNIKMAEPADLQKYLGCVHHVTQKIVEGETITNVTFDMKNYFQAAIDQYLELATEKLNEVNTGTSPLHRGGSSVVPDREVDPRLRPEASPHLLVPGAGEEEPHLEGIPLHRRH